MSELNPLIDRLNGIIQSASPSVRKSLAKEIATKVRISQAARIKDNNNPDGSAYAERKTQTLRANKGAIRRRMFQKLIRAKWLKARTNATEASIEFIGKAGRIARVSQYGLRDKVNKHGLEVQYQQRELLGLTEAEISQIEDTVISSMTKW